MRFIVALLLLPALSHGQAKYAVFREGKKVGSVNITQKIREDGSKLVQTSIDFGQAKVRMENTFDKEGTATRKFMEMTGSVKRTVVATFDKAGANVVIDQKGNRETRQVSLVPNAPRANKSEFWFIRDTPKVGAEVQSYVFSLDSLSWELMTTQYRGKASVSVAGKKTPAHYVVSGDTEAWLDEKGYPLLIIKGQTRFERLPE